MKELKKLLFDNQSHIVIVGRTGSGKTTTVAKIIELLMKRGKLFVLIDYAGEYWIPGIPIYPPIFSYKLLRNSLPEVISEIIRVQSQTAGTWTYDAVAKLVPACKSFKELIQRLEQDSEFPSRDAGARAAFSRLNMLSRRFKDEIPEFIQHYSLGNLQITERKMAVTLLLAQIFNMALTRKIEAQSFYLIIEEALNIPEELLKQLLTQLRGYGIKVVITTQEFKDWFQHYNLIVHDLGNESPYRYNIPRNNLKVGEVLVYNVEKHKWKKVKVKPPVLVKVLPKSQQQEIVSIEEESEESVKEDVKEELPEDPESSDSKEEERSENIKEDKVKENNISSKDSRLEIG